MKMDFFNEFIRPELLVLVPVLYLIGMGIKKSKINDKWIPLLLGGCGITLASAYIFAMSPILAYADILFAAFSAITQGILCAGASVYANQIIKQAQKDKNNDEKGE